MWTEATGGAWEKHQSTKVAYEIGFFDDGRHLDADIERLNLCLESKSLRLLDSSSFTESDNEVWTLSRCHLSIVAYAVKGLKSFQQDGQPRR